MSPRQKPSSFRASPLAAVSKENMSENALKETVIRLAEPVVRSLGLVIWGVEVVQAGRMVVRLFVDVPPGAPESLQAADREENEASAAPSSASIDQCEEISRHLGRKFWSL